MVTSRKDAGRLGGLLEEAGYEPNKRFNAAHGHSRLSFAGPTADEHVDVFIEEFSLCHVLPLADRLAEHPLTIPLEDLLLSKLQVARLNQKDVTDAVAILMDHEVGRDLDTNYITSLLASDWGWWRTSTETITNIVGLLDRVNVPEADVSRVREQFSRLVEAVDAAPKSLRWRARARVGDRRPWRVDPDDVSA
jgi:hypothetical protein